MIGTALAERGEFDVPLRELEHTTLTLDCVMDQGAYFDVKRHRIMTQTPQPLTVGSGLCRAAGRSWRPDSPPSTIGRMQAAAQAYREIAPEFPHEAAYVVPNAYNRRVLLTLNLRELFHFTHCAAHPTATLLIGASRSKRTKLPRKSILLLRRLCAAKNIHRRARSKQEFFARTA